MSGVYTIYNCGTNYHKDSGDLISKLGKTTPGSLVNDGPGSGEFKPNIFGGRPDPTDWSPLVSWFGIVGGLMFGTGVEKNVERSVDAIKKLSSLPSTLNMAGWSRGAVTCLKIANELQKDAKLRSIRVNIFAVDPVPGTSFVGNDHMWDDIGLSANINEYVAIIAQHERRLEMTPVLPSNTEKRGWVDLMPGVHSSLVQETAGKLGPANLVQHLATRFLLKHGTSISAPRLMGNHQILATYDRLKREWNQYVKMGEDEGGFIRGTFGDTTRPIKNEKQDVKVTLLPRLSNFFVNNHHRQIFGLVYPNALAEINGVFTRAFSPLRKSSWKTDLKQMALYNPETLATILGTFPGVGAEFSKR